MEGLPKEVSAELDSALREVRAAAAEFRGGRPVAPLGPLAQSPVLAAQSGPPGPATTLPFGPVAARAPPASALPTHLQAVWHKPKEGAPPTERLSADGQAYLAYEVSSELDACGGPIWRRVPMSLSPEAELCLAQHVGAARGAYEMAVALRTIAAGDVTPE